MLLDHTARWRKSRSLAMGPVPHLGDGLIEAEHTMAIYIESETFLDHMFNACTTDQLSEFIPEKRGFRIHGHSTTIRLERAFWNVLEAMAQAQRISLPELIERIYDGCLVANDKNLASCLRVICMKFVNVYSH